ncbi:MAG: hypothetical protein OXE78_05565, partial [Gammaproteobacteria bacterium]|nr:hypothetical protein [Gammaproteobacteria bacterium]
LDSDEQPNAHWEDVKDQLSQAGVRPPAELNPNGCIFHNDPTIGVWIMPNNKSVGELENFVLEMVPEDDSIWPVSVEYINNIPEKERKFRAEKTDKAKLHAWLSTRKEPGRMGAAIGAEDLGVSNQLSTSFLNWLEKLFM